MQFTVAGAIGGPEAVAASRNPLVRQFTVGGGVSAVPLDQGSGTWATATPATTGAFSAVGYFFARRLNAEVGVPVGAVHAGIGGSVVEAWTSPEALATLYPNGVMVGESANIHPRNKVPAGRRLAGNTVIVTSPAVREPMAVRYA